MKRHNDNHPSRSYARILAQRNHQTAIRAARVLMPLFTERGRDEFTSVLGHVIALFALSALPEATPPHTTKPLTEIVSEVREHASRAYGMMLDDASDLTHRRQS